MTLAKLLQITPGVTAVIGGGGKTTLLRMVGGELAARGHTVLLGTTTKIFPFADVPNLLSPTETELAAALERYRMVCAGTPQPETGKLTAPGIPMARLAQLAEYVLVEADGSAHRPLKAHAAHEPVVPPEAGQTICVVGMTGMGKPIQKAAHRPELYAELAGTSPEVVVTPEMAARVLNAEALADQYFLNQADRPEVWEWARRLASALTCPAVVGSLQKGEYVSCLF